MSHLESNDIINSAQHGFRPEYSSTSQLIKIVKHLAKDTDSQKQIDMIFLDFSKVFDTVPHQHLPNCDIMELTIKYITGYLIG